jgi:hypothetical protein
VTPHPELLRLLAHMVREVAKAGPEPILQAAEQLQYLGWMVRGLQRGAPANDSTWTADSGEL